MKKVPDFGVSCGIYGCRDSKVVNEKKIKMR